jgi:hypothetical protein
MNELKRVMFEQARKRYDSILPCAKADSWNDCFTVEGNKLLFWFNTEDQSTHLMSFDL